MADYPEILSPAGSFQSLEAAVRSGADAVYLGASEMNARRNAENFDEVKLREAVAYCHIRGVLVYLTLNILIGEKELDRAIRIVRSAVSSGIDGIIVQDLGLARLIGTAFPELPLHASTQMSILSPAALKPLKELGFKRVVAGREMDREQLKKLCDTARDLDMEVEVFVHGALCMSVSGQCLMSAVIGGRSGNRGLCAGPCRLPFSVSGGTGYDLSLKDLSLIPYLRELKNMGVSSFKIEGRMKRPEYVASATAAVRSALYDENIPEMLTESLNNVFSRSGFTSGYYEGKLGVSMFGIRTETDKNDANKVFPIIHEYYRNERQSVPLVIRAEISENGSSLTLFDGKNTVTVKGEIPERAKMRSLDRETVISYITKLGSTPYFAGDVAVKIKDGLYLRGADLNAMRREAVERLNVLRATPRKIAENPYSKSKEYYYPQKNPALVVFFSDVDKIPQNLGGVTAVAVPIEQNPPEKLPENIRLIADIPRGMDEDLMMSRLRVFKNHGCKAAVCSNLAAVKCAADCAVSPIAGLGMNICNSETVSVLKGIGVRAVMISAELKMREIVSMDTALPKGIFAYGRLPLMLTKNCPLKNGISCKDCKKDGFLTDRLENKFPVSCRAGFSEVLNSVPTYLADRLSETEGLDFLCLSFTDETPETAEAIIKAYRYGTNVTPKDYTRGLYYRKVE